LERFEGVGPCHAGGTIFFETDEGGEYKN
jgi:hypothetical protein